jgi:hypothetical protein
VVLPPGLPEDLVPEGSWSLLTDMPPLTVGQLDAREAVISTAAIAVTGTVTPDHGPGQGRRALPLLPDRHICVVRQDQTVRAPTLISGPLPPATSNSTGWKASTVRAGCPSRGRRPPIPSR